MLEQPTQRLLVQASVRTTSTDNYPREPQRPRVVDIAAHDIDLAAVVTEVTRSRSNQHEAGQLLRRCHSHQAAGRCEPPDSQCGTQLDAVGTGCCCDVQSSN